MSSATERAASALLFWAVGPGGTGVPDNHERLARSDEPEGSSGRLLERRGIVAEPPAFELQGSVLETQAPNRVLEHCLLPASPDRREVTIVADDRVHDEPERQRRERHGQPPAPLRADFVRSARPLTHTRFRRQGRAVVVRKIRCHV